MVKKKNHYIPQSFLRNFTKSVKNQDYIYCSVNKGDIFPINIVNVCAENYLYDIAEINESNRSVIEDFYASEVDSNFEEITAFVKDSTQAVLSDDMRFKIIKSVLSLYFRTPKFLKNDAKLNELLGIKLSAEQKTKNKIDALKNHFKLYTDLIKHKISDGIAVNTIVDDCEFIIGDNPVIMRNTQGEHVDIFATDNIFHIPITPKHSITITPHEEKGLKGTFARYEYILRTVITINHDIERYHEKFLMGTEFGINDYRIKIVKYNNSPEGEKMLADTIELSVIINELMPFIEQGNIFNEEFIQLFKKH